MEWKKYISREFLTSIALCIIASLFTNKVLTADNYGTVVPIWAAACGGFLAIWVTGLTFQKVKANGNGS